MKKIAASLGVAALAAGAGWTQQYTPDTTSNQQTTTESTQTTTTTTTNADTVRPGTPAFLQQWPEASRTIASSMIEKYGQPDEFTQGELVWRYHAPFKRIVVYRFPGHHYDMLAETVDYFYGSSYEQNGASAPIMQMAETTVLPDTGKFELTSVSNSEDNNILALNLANDVLHGRISPLEARQEYADASMRTLSGRTVAATQSLTFTPARPGINDWDSVLEAREGSGN